MPGIFDFLGGINATSQYSNWFTKGLYSGMGQGGVNNPQGMKDPKGNPLSTSDMSFMKSTSAIGGAGQIADSISGMLPNANNDSTTNAINAGYDAASTAIMSIPGYGTLIGGGMKLMGLANKGLAALTGGATTIKAPTTTFDKIASSNFFAMTPEGLANSLGKTSVSGTDNNLASLASTYGGVQTSSATDIGGLDNAFSWLTGGRNKAKAAQAKTNYLNEQNADKAMAVQSDRRQKLAATNSTGNIFQKDQQQLQGGFNQNQMRMIAAKKGTKLTMLKRIKAGAKLNIALESKADENPVNVIPDGALHARNNNMEMEGITNKGIPVVSYEEGGDVLQHAEIERNELILHKELTLKLEDLHKQYKAGDESALIEAGKLLTHEILENTEDNTGLLNT